jgi:hypothetical protein
MLIKTLRGCLLVLLGGAFAIPPASAQHSRLAGDAQAVAAIERMIERFGGPEVWSRGRSLYVEYDGWRTEPNEPVIERAWRDLHEPYQHAEYEGRSFLNVYDLSPSQGSRTRDGTVEYFDKERHAATVDRYPFGFYTSFRTLAVGDPRIRLTWQEPNRVVVTTTDGKERGWWQIDSTGALIKWGATSPTGESFEYVYGPMRAFGNVNFPAWGASTNGWWRWDYVRIDVSRDPIPESVLRSADQE